MLTSEDVAAPADDDSDGDDVGATASVATQTSARLKLQQYYGGDLQHFDITHMYVCLDVANILSKSINSDIFVRIMLLF